MIVVDTSVLIDYRRGETTPWTERLAELEADDVPFVIPLVPEGPRSLHHEAARIFFDGRRRGVTVRSTVDCLIAAQALAAKATLLHNDDDFERIATLRPLKTIRG